MNIPLQELTPEAFAPFGEVIQMPARSQDADGAGWKWWGDLALLPADGVYAVGYLDLKPNPLAFDWAERHMQTVEMLIPSGGDCVVYVGPADYPETPERLPELERFRAFRLSEGQAILLDKGVWHGAPLAIEKTLKVIVLLLEHTGSRDGYVVRFPEQPVQIKK